MSEILICFEEWNLHINKDKSVFKAKEIEFKKLCLIQEIKQEMMSDLTHFDPKLLTVHGTDARQNEIFVVLFHKLPKARKTP